MAYRDQAKYRAARQRYRDRHKAEIAAYNHAYWASNAERLGGRNRAKALAWVHADPERMSERLRRLAEWAEKNPDEVRAARRRWREENRESVAAKRHATYISQKDREYAYAWARRARVRGAEGTFTATEWVALRAFYGERCLACGIEGALTIDHVVPLACGGRHSADNIQPLCRPCNLKKSTRTVDYRHAVYSAVPRPPERTSPLART